MNKTTTHNLVLIKYLYKEKIRKSTQSKLEENLKHNLALYNEKITLEETIHQLNCLKLVPSKEVDNFILAYAAF